MGFCRNGNDQLIVIYGAIALKEMEIIVIVVNV